eukprot:gene5085-4973_t
MNNPKTEANTVPTTEQRLFALETMLQQLVLVLECEPQFSAQALGRWMDVARKHMRMHEAATPGELNALDTLQRSVLTQ